MKIHQHLKHILRFLSYYESLYDSTGHLHPEIEGYLHCSIDFVYRLSNFEQKQFSTIIETIQHLHNKLLPNIN